MIPAVIVVDDSESDRYLARRAISRANVAARVVELDDGEDLLPLIDDPDRAVQEFGEPPPPVLILLDINMPSMNGFEVLRELQARTGEGQARYDWFVVMMFSSSNHQQDRERSLCYPFVRDFLVKPIDVSTLKQVVERHYGAL